MDFQQFGIDPRILEGAPGLESRVLFHEKMLLHAVQNGENVCAKISVETGRDAIVLLPALQWLASNAGGRALALVPDPAEAARLAAVAREIGAGIGLETCVVSPGEEGSAGGVTLEGNPGASFVVGAPDSLLGAEASGLLRLSAFGYLLVDEGEVLAELPEELLRKISAALKPAAERRSLVACSKISVKAKNLAWDLADNPVEIRIEEEEAKGQSAASETWLLKTDEKLRFLLGILARERPPFVCVFCNLKPSAEEISLRLDYNGVESDYILGALAQDRKLELFDRLKEEEGGVLVLTDEGSAGLPSGRFPLLVNFDIPLEPELYVKRLEMLDRAYPGAKVVNLACERYVYGLPAVEQHIGAKLESRQVTEELLRAEDKSADLLFEKPQAERGGQRHGSRAGRLVPPAGGASAPRGEGGHRGGEEGRAGGRGGRSGHGGHEGRGRRDEGRDSRRRREGRDEDRSPEIRQSIAELTGAAPASPRREEAPKRQPKGGSERGAQGRKGGKGQGGRGGQQPQRGGQAGRGGRDQRPQPRDGQPRDQQSRNQQGRGQGGQGRGPQGREESRENPYELPMEERMKRYREKYGQRLESSPAQGGKGGQKKGRPQQEGQRQAPRQGQQAHRPEGVREAPKSKAKPQKPGLFEKIRGLFGK